MNDKQLVQNLIEKHLGPIEPVDRDIETKVIEILQSIAYLNNKNVQAALIANGIKITTRQLKPYKDAVIMARMGGNNDIEFIRTRAQANFYPGAQIKFL
jgi:hypothetical protein